MVFLRGVGGEQTCGGVEDADEDGVASLFGLLLGGFPANLMSSSLLS